MTEIRVRDIHPDGRSDVRLFRDYETTDEYESPVIRTAAEQVEDHRASCMSEGVLVEVIG